MFLAICDFDIPETNCFQFATQLCFEFVSVDDQAGQIKIAVFGTSLPLPTIEDGVIATITLYGKTSVAGQSPVNLKQVSVGDDLGRSVPVDFDDGMIIFGIGGNSSLFLPLMQMP